MCKSWSAAVSLISLEVCGLHPTLRYAWLLLLSHANRNMPVLQSTILRLPRVEYPLFNLAEMQASWPYFVQVLGKRLGKSMAAVGNAVKQMSAQQIAEYESSGSITLAGEVLTSGEIRVLNLLLIQHHVRK